MKSYKHFKSSLRESYLRIQERGSTYGIQVNWRGKLFFVQMFFPNVFGRPPKSEILASVRKAYPDAKVLYYNPVMRDPTKPLLFAGEK
tara:strand:- start:102 stop:365 length:264 start_codon:yes stop_codon:yes gene_type:complete